METDLKKNWKDTRFQSLGEEQRAEIMEGRRRTALQQLADRYKMFSNIALPMVLIIPFSAYRIVMNEAPTGIKLGWMALAMIYFGMCSVMDRWLYKGISGIDCAAMTVSEVSNKAMYFRKKHLQFMVVLVPMAILIIGGLVYMTNLNVYFLYGVIAGGLIGLILGLRQFFNFMADYKTIAE